MQILKLQTLEMILLANEDSVNDFSKFASRLYENGLSIHSLALAPDGIIRYLYPEEDTDDAFLNVLEDPLTGLYNNRYFSATLAKLSGEGQPFLLFFLDMNRFKQVNDTYGHKAGDALLMEASKRLRQCLRDEDYAFRIGGDEFSLIVPQTASAPSGDALISSIKENIQKPLQIDDITLYMGTSCGYASYPSDNTDTEALIKIADERMYQDKEAAHRADSTAVRL